MARYVFQRIGIAALTLLAIIMLLFLLMEFVPGTPFDEEKLSPAQIEQNMKLYGLDKPWPFRFAKYALNMLTGNFGVSYVISKNIPVTDLIKNRFPVSIRIGLQAVVLGTAAGLFLGIGAALKHGGFLDTLCTFLSVVCVSIPSYVFALCLSYLVGFKTGWFPLIYRTDQAFMSGVMPTIALSLSPMANIARFTRVEMLEALDSDYVQLAESKGVRGFRLVFGHVLRNALIPIVTVLGPMIVGLLTGSLVIEKIFSVPGIGQLLITSIQTNDYNVIVVMSFLYSALYIGIMLVVDILYGIIDPRIRIVKEKQDD
ncbi:MAG: ABC transporter permease [Treponema sp.]|jgi:oligopeptide transport system permease protein|nr:ABC transporter permease [Treponema sp.]